MASDLIDVAALGRPFSLGMLYDARKDALIPGLTLWNENTLQENTAQRSQPSSKFEISASDTIESKSSLLDVEASLKASFLSGLIDVGGSAKYLNDQKKSHNQSRVTCQYKATTHFKELSMIDLGKVEPHQMDVIQQGLATHVVTGILYGANAFFVFDNKKSEDSSVQDMEGSMYAVIKKIPSLNIEGEIKLKLSDKEVNLTKNFSCKFYGDFILKSNPSTFEDAVKTYEQLPQLLGEKGEKAVPLKVWLMPLKNLDPKAAELMNEISVRLVRKAQDALEDLREMEMRCNDSLEDRVVENFPQIQKDLSKFQKLCDNYETHLKQAMATTFPSIRDGKEDESSLRQLFEDRDKSPFSHKELSKWLDHKEREINVIRFCVDTMEGMKIVLNQSELDREVLAPGVEDALCFVFTSLDSDDCRLDAMTNYLDTMTTSECTSEVPWYFSDEILTKMRKKATAFHDLAKALKNNSRTCFFGAAIENEKYTGATIYHYKNGILLTDDFSKLQLPPVESITDRRDLIWYACDLTLDPNSAYKNLILSEGNKKATFGEEQPYPDHPDRFTQCPRVLCKESLSGRHYWEVEWNVKMSGDNWEGVFVGVSHKGIKRDGDRYQSSIHHTANSWCFGETILENIHHLQAWHNSKMWESPFPSGGCSRVGVFLDWPAGTLSFYKVSDNTLSHLYTFHTTFTEPVCPGFKIWQSPNSAYLCPFE